MAQAVEEREAVFSGGDVKFLQPWFDEIRYKGVIRVEVGRVDDDVETRSIRVAYDAARCSYKLLLGTFWRHVNPVSLDQFPTTAAEAGDRAFRTAIWVTNDEERRLALESKAILEKSGVYGKGTPFVTEILDAKPFRPVPEDGQDFYSSNEKLYEKLAKKSGREAFFEKTYRPITTTACESKTCGYVYFPCSGENGCVSVVSGAW